MRRSLIVLVVSSSLVLTGASGSIGMSGYRDTGLDADDLARGDHVNPDIRSTTRKVRVDAEGRRRLAVTIRAYERLGPEWSVTVSIDSRGGWRRDGTVAFIKRDGDAVYCGWHFFVEDTWAAQARQDSERARCGTRLNRIRPTKPIRWWVRSPHTGVKGPVDRAPDHGWFA